MTQSKVNWRDNGVRIVRSNQLDLNTPQTEQPDEVHWVDPAHPKP